MGQNEGETVSHSLTKQTVNSDEVVGGVVVQSVEASAPGPLSGRLQAAGSSS